MMSGEFRLQFTLDGEPIAKQRHRTTKRGHAYNPQANIEKSLRTEIMAALGCGWMPCERALILTLDAYFTRPKSHYGTGKNSRKLKPSSPIFHTTKPDYSNIVKFYEDLMNGLIYHDDCQIVGSGEGRKHYIPRWDRPFVRISLVSVD